MTLSRDIDAVGTLITTEFGGPPQSQPVPARNYQGYGASGQGLTNVYPYLYDPTDFVPPTDESEGALSLQEQQYVGEVQYIQENDPSFLSGEITEDVVFENPLDTLNENAIDVGTNTVDIAAVSDVPSNGPFAYGVTADDEQVSAESEAPVEAPVVEAAVVAPEAAESAPEATEASPFFNAPDYEGEGA